MTLLQHRRSWPWFFQVHYLACFLFVVIQPLLRGYGQARILGTGLVLVALFWQMSKRTSVVRMKKPPELLYHFWWVVWTLVSGFIVAKYPEWLWFNGKTLLQIVVLFWSLYALFIRQEKTNYFYYALILLAILNILAIRMGISANKEDVMVGGFVQNDVVDTSVTRAEGFAGNSNAAGFLFMAAFWACMMLLSEERRLTRFFKAAILLPLMAIFSYYTLQTGSRKSLLVLAIVACIWLTWVLPGRLSVKSILISLVAIIFILVVSATVIAYVMDNTLIGERFYEVLDAGGGNVAEGFKSNERYSFYLEGLKMWIDNPIAGVGFAHFGFFASRNVYSHSDYIEPLACTGTVGFILYHGFAATIFLRIVRLLRRRLPDFEKYKLKCMLLFMIGNHYLIGLGCPFWPEIRHNIILVFIGVYTWRLWQECVLRRPYTYRT